MSTQTILDLIDQVNNKTHHDQIFLCPIGENVLEARIWITEESGSKKLKYPTLTGSGAYFITDKNNVVVGAVMDSGPSELHWVIRPNDRGNGYLSNALTDYILPYLLHVKEREYQLISFTNTSEEFIPLSRGVALRVGFKPFNDRYRICQDEVKMYEWKGVTNVPVDYVRNQELVRKAFHALGLLESIIDELEMTYGWSGSLRDIINQDNRYEIQQQIENAHFKGE